MIYYYILMIENEESEYITIFFSAAVELQAESDHWPKVWVGCCGGLQDNHPWGTDFCLCLEKRKTSWQFTIFQNKNITAVVELKLNLIFPD